MKKLFFIFLVISSFRAHCQNISLSELFIVCNKSDWTEVNEYLLHKGWDYYESSKGDDTHYNTITWALERNNYNNTAQGWFYLYTFEGFPNKIMYSFSNKSTYNNIKNGINSSGMKLLTSNIEDNSIQTKYSNSSFIVAINIEKRKISEYEENFVTAYSITVIKKSGVFDPDNGLKIINDKDGNKESEYYLKDGNINGEAKTYYPSGKLKIITSFNNGDKTGLSKEYDEDGNQTAEFTYLHGELTGPYKIFESRRLSITGSLVNGKKNGHFEIYDSNGRLEKEYDMKEDVLDGKFVEYYYIEDERKPIAKENGQYNNNERTGLWQLIKYVKTGFTLLGSVNYVSGIKEGNFKEVRRDSIIFGTYRNGELNGNYAIYSSVLGKLLGEVTGDTTNSIILCEGKYSKDKKSDHWKYYAFSSYKSLVSEGDYFEGNKVNEWKYYFPYYVDNKGIKLNYSGKLYLIENYQNGLLNGKSVRYAHLRKDIVKCDSSQNKNPSDTCYKSKIEKLYEIANYKNDRLYGPYELRDSSDIILFQGYYLFDQKDGKWLESYKNQDINNNEYYLCYRGNYKSGKRIGIWEEFIQEGNIFTRYSYEDGELNGKTVSYKSDHIIKDEKGFEHGQFKDLSIYDSLGVRIVDFYEILAENSTELKCRRTQFDNEGKVSLIYTLKKDNPNPISSDIFEIIFAIKTGKLSDGTQGYPDGEINFYNNKNQILARGNLYKKSKVGKWTYFYNSSNIYSEQEFINEIGGVEHFFEINSNRIFSGLFVEKYDNGIVKWKIKISKGLRNGKSITYDEAGKEIKTEKYNKGILVSD